MGDWAFQYDTLNRLTAAAPADNAPTPFAHTIGCFGYDSFGNRTLNTYVTAGDCTGANTPNAMYNANNQVTFVSQSAPISYSAPAGFTYDGAGNVKVDGNNQYAYDPEGRICAVYSSITMGYTGYLYNAGGQRVASGSLSNLSCNLGTNGFSLKKNYLLDQSGNQVTELNQTGGWVHSNVWVGAHLDATYDTLGLHFHLADPLGTRRVQANVLGQIEETCQSLPFGDALNCVLTSSLATADDATEHHFTGKERDTESGNDYFEARYYSSSMGRMMSPDPLPWIHWQSGNEDDQKRFDAYIANPQNFNMYAYVLNNPLNKTDPTGMNACGTNNDSSCKVTVTITDRSKDANGNYNDKYAGLKGNGSYNATATVSVNGKVTGTFLADTTSSGGKFATIQNGTYDGVLHNHHGDPNKPSIELMSGGSNHIPTIAPNPAQGGASFATDVLIHPAGGTNSNPLGYTGLLPNGHGVSEACQLICSVQYQQFLGATGIRPADGSAPQQHFSVILNSSANQ